MARKKQAPSDSLGYLIFGAVLLVALIGMYFVFKGGAGQAVQMPVQTADSAVQRLPSVQYGEGDCCFMAELSDGSKREICNERLEDAQSQMAQLIESGFADNAYGLSCR